jgi:hypothetical protein
MVLTHSDRARAPVATVDAIEGLMGAARQNAAAVLRPEISCDSSSYLVLLASDAVHQCYYSDWEGAHSRNGAYARNGLST